MLSFFYSYRLDLIKKKLIYIYVFNVTDIIFTLLLLRTGYYREANIFMVDVVENVPASIGLKVIFLAALLMFFYHRIQKATTYQLNISNKLINFMLLFYALINVTHILWFALIPVYALM